MLKEVIKYTNIDGTEAEETVYLHLTTRNLLTYKRKFEKIIQAAAKDIGSVNDDELIDALISVVELSIGYRDGDQFKTSDEFRENFVNGLAGDALIKSMIQNPEKLMGAINSIVGGATDDKKLEVLSGTVVEGT